MKTYMNRQLKTDMNYPIDLFIMNVMLFFYKNNKNLVF